jgi:hypothetical protein
MVPFLKSKASSLAVITVAIIIVLPVSVDVRLAAFSFPKEAIVVYSVFFLTLERG